LYDTEEFNKELNDNAPSAGVTNFVSYTLRNNKAESCGRVCVQHNAFGAQLGASAPII